MSRRKLVNFEKNRNNPLVVEPGKELFLGLRGKWNSDFFEKTQPIVLEIGCGRGEYTIGLAENCKDKNFVGVDIKGSRLWKGAEQALQAHMRNVAFVRNKVENIQQQFCEGEVSEIWITFPDPRPRSRDERKRLTSPRFLRIYSLISTPNGLWVHLKTDDDGIYQYTLEVVQMYQFKTIAATEDLYDSIWKDDHFGIQTTYERKFLAAGKKIKYIRFQLPPMQEPENRLFKDDLTMKSSSISDSGFYQAFPK